MACRLVFFLAISSIGTGFIMPNGKKPVVLLVSQVTEPAIWDLILKYSSLNKTATDHGSLATGGLPASEVPGSSLSNPLTPGDFKIATSYLVKVTQQLTSHRNRKLSPGEKTQQRAPTYAAHSIYR